MLEMAQGVTLTDRCAHITDDQTALAQRLTGPNGYRDKRLLLAKTTVRFQARDQVLEFIT